MARIGVRRIERQVGGPRLHHRDNPREQIEAAAAKQRHDILRTNAGRLKMACEPVCPRVQLPVSKRAVLVDYGHLVGGLPHLRFKQLGIGLIERSSCLSLVKIK